MKKSLFGLLTLALLGAVDLANVNAQTTLAEAAKGAVGRPVQPQQRVPGKNYPVEVQAAPDKIRNDAATERVEVSVDHKDLVYYEGETVKISVRSSTPGYLYLVSFDVDNNPTLLFPNEWNPDNRIQKDQTYTYPEENQDFILRIVGPNFGTEKVRAFVTREEIQELKGIEYGKDATDIKPVLKDFESALQKRVAKDVKASKGIALEQKPRLEVTIGECSFETKGGSRRASVGAQPRRVAVIFGINDYNDPGIRDLKCCVADAQAMDELARERMGVAKENCLIFTDKQVSLAIVRKLFTELLPQHTKPGDEIIVYWSGHGDKAASGVTRENDAFLVPVDGDLNDRSTMLGEHEFGLWLKDCLQGRKIVLFLDACHSGGMLLGGGKGLTKPNAEGGLTGAWKSLTETPEIPENPEFVFDFGSSVVDSSAKSLGHVGMFAMASSNQYEVSWEGSGSLGLSVMTYYLVQTIEKGGASLTHKDLVDAIRPQVLEYVKKHRKGATQTVVSYDKLNPGVKLIRK